MKISNLFLSLILLASVFTASLASTTSAFAQTNPDANDAVKKGQVNLEGLSQGLEMIEKRYGVECNTGAPKHFCLKISKWIPFCFETHKTACTKPGSRLEIKTRSYFSNHLFTSVGVVSPAFRMTKVLLKEKGNRLLPIDGTNPETHRLGSEIEDGIRMSLSEKNLTCEDSPIKRWLCAGPKPKFLGLHCHSRAHWSCKSGESNESEKISFVSRVIAKSQRVNHKSIPVPGTETLKKIRILTRSTK
ncbi:MAG: hypothetical protein HYX41_07950 [Bdellovibrio sp.]|nr:hypothetical protein [Bdellovibrio sp.]